MHNRRWKSCEHPRRISTFRLRPMCSGSGRYDELSHLRARALSLVFRPPSYTGLSTKRRAHAPEPEGSHLTQLISTGVSIFAIRPFSSVSRERTLRQTPVLFLILVVHSSSLVYSRRGDCWHAIVPVKKAGALRSGRTSDTFFWSRSYKRVYWLY